MGWCGVGPGCMVIVAAAHRKSFGRRVCTSSPRSLTSSACSLTTSRRMSSPMDNPPVVRAKWKKSCVEPCLLRMLKLRIPNKDKEIAHVLRVQERHSKLLEANEMKRWALLQRMEEEERRVLRQLDSSFQ